MSRLSKLVLAFQWGVIVPCLAYLWSCASSPQHTLSPNQIEPPSNFGSSNKPIHPVPNQSPSQGFSYQLPLGIGGRFDLFVTETADNVSDLYESYVKPLRKGKVFNNHPYVMQYSILPSSGELFEADNLLHDKSMKSDYDFQVGMTRQFSNFSDFFSKDFWLAKGEYGPDTPRATYIYTDLYGMPPMFGRAQPEEETTPRLAIDIYQLLDDKWGLKPNAPEGLVGKISSIE